MKEQEIIQKCKAKDANAQKAMVYQYSELLMALAYRYTMNREDAKDIVQEVFMQLFEKIDHYDKAKGAFIPWLKSMAIRIILMHLRKKKRIFENQQKYVNHIQGSIDYQLIDSDVETQELYRVLLQLPDNQRIVFSLHAIEGYSHKEIAEKLLIKESHSRTIASRARKSLQKILEGANFLKTGIYEK